MLAIDVTHTSHARSRTGIQQVTRELVRQLRQQTEIEPIVYDRFARHWRRLDVRERALLEAHRPTEAPTSRRSARWSHWQKLRGSMHRFVRDPRQLKGGFDACLVPELFGPDRAEALSGLRAIVRGPMMAIFHDAIPLKHPEWTPRKTVEWFPRYVHALRGFDAIAAVSSASARDLAEAMGAATDFSSERIRAIPLGSRFEAKPLPPPKADPPRLLMVGTFEARKNQISLLRAAEDLWERGMRFELDFAGGLNRETGSSAWSMLERMRAGGRPVRAHGPVSDEQLEQLFASCHATVYPSLYEGFGLPVLESLSRGRPCVASARGGLEETVHGGGCLIVEPEPRSIAAGIQELITDTELYQRLCEEARERHFRSFDDQARELLSWMQELRGQASS